MQRSETMGSLIVEKKQLQVPKADQQKAQAKRVIQRSESMGDLNVEKKFQQVPEANQQKAQATRKQLRGNMQKYMEIPKHIQKFIFYYAFNNFTTALQIIVSVPIYTIISILNKLKSLIGIGKRTKDTCFYQMLIILTFFTVTQDWQFFDVSFLYHSFRGQSSVKLYGVGLALEISEKLLTMLGTSLLSRINFILKYKTQSYRLVMIQLIIAYIYTLVHFFTLYLDFILYIIVLNSQPKNMLMYFFVVNLGKMKAATFKKFQKNSFKKSLLFDAKDRLLKITHSIFFIATTWQRIEAHDIGQVILVLFYCALIDHLRHFSSLAMAGNHSEADVIYRQSLFSYEKQVQDKVQRSCSWDFTVIPYVLFLLKFLDITVWALKKHDKMENILSCVYIGLVLYVYVFANFFSEWLKPKSKTEKSQV